MNNILELSTVAAIEVKRIRRPFIDLKTVVSANQNFPENRVTPLYAKQLQRLP